MDNVETKICTKCNIKQNISEFRIKNGKYINSECKSCENTRSKEYQIAKRNGTYVKAPRKSKPLPTHKICAGCEIDKDILEFRIRSKGDAKRGWGYTSKCIDCENNESMKYADAHKEDKKKNRKTYYENNKTKELENNKIWRNNNRDRINAQAKEREKNDVNFKLRKRISASINSGLKYNGGSKRNKSILDKLPYTINQLKEHLENQFEPWMNWNNHGKYKVKTWDDNNPSTWTWQIDHIKPHSTFEYKDMECQSFLDCWSLSNLRPLLSKQNIIDGTSRVRHNQSDSKDK